MVHQTASLVRDDGHQEQTAGARHYSNFETSMVVGRALEGTGGIERHLGVGLRMAVLCSPTGPFLTSILRPPKSTIPLSFQPLTPYSTDVIVM